MLLCSISTGFRVNSAFHLVQPAAGVVGVRPPHGALVQLFRNSRVSYHEEKTPKIKLFLSQMAKLYMIQDKDMRRYRSVEADGFAYRVAGVYLLFLYWYLLCSPRVDMR